jgi:hypothetical protein
MVKTRYTGYSNMLGRPVNQMHDTWGKRSTFDYSGDVKTGTEIKFGKDRKAFVTAKEYRRLRKQFLNQVVAVNTSRTAPGGLGEWLRNNVTKVAIATYVAPILEREGYAVRVSQHDIKIIK